MGVFRRARVTVRLLRKMTSNPKRRVPMLVR